MFEIIDYITFNSKLILTTTKFTKEIAFNEIFHSHIIPCMLTRMSIFMNRIITAAIKSNPVNMKDAVKIVANEMPKENKQSFQIDRYCS